MLIDANYLSVMCTLEDYDQFTLGDQFLGAFLARRLTDHELLLFVHGPKWLKPKLM